MVNRRRTVVFIPSDLVPAASVPGTFGGFTIRKEPPKKRTKIMPLPRKTSETGGSGAPAQPYKKR
jgi:hypothetical protein